MSNSSLSLLPVIVLGSSIDHIKDYLREGHNATDDELTYINTILQLRAKERSPLPMDQNGYGSPSIVIDDFLYHGDFVQASNINLLNKLNIRHIISVIDMSLNTTVTTQCNVLWINLPDEVHADVKQYFEQTNEFLLKCKEKNEKVLVHCQMGISRSSSIVLAYLMKFHHDTLYKAYDYLLERRRIAIPNPAFLLQLVRYEKELRETKEIDQNKNNDDKENPIEIVPSSMETNST